MVFLGLSSTIFTLLFTISLIYFVFVILVSRKLLPTNYKLLLPDNIGTGLKRVFFEVLLQTKVIRHHPLVGAMHAFVMWGFLAFLPITVGHLWVGLNNLSVTNWLVRGWYGDFVAIWSVLVIIGMLKFVHRRFRVRPKELGNKLSVTSGLISIAIIFLMVTYLLDWTSLLVAAYFPDWQFLSEYSLSWKINWWIHTLSFLAMFWIIPNSKHLHLLLAPLNIFLGSDTMNTMQPLDLANEDLGLVNFSQLSWKDILDVNSCVECGRCTNVCPANLSGGTLDPKYIILNMQKGLLGGGELIAGSQEEQRSGKVWISETDLFECTTCGACKQVCPVGIDHVSSKIIDIRRGLVSVGDTDNPRLAKLFTTMERAPHNPWGITSETRRKFVKEANFPIFDGGQEWLFWLGCGNSYDPHGQKVAKAMQKIFEASGVSWGVLENEVCCGEPARRAGNELVYLTLAEKVNEIFVARKVKKIVTCCPHCTTMFDKDYRQLSDYESMGIKVYHHTELIHSVLPKLSLAPDSGTVTYHDPCYLARGRKIIDQPRDILRSCGAEIKEMSRCKSDTFCCGAGGAQIFIADDKNEHGGERINHMRFSEAESTGAETIVVACPYCPIMLRDAATHVDSKVEILDIAEKIARQLVEKKGGSKS